jgi:hypothetical protein
MHEFYRRMQSVFQRAGSNRNRFCKKYGHNYQTLQAYWNTDKLPPGNVLEDLATEFNVSLDALVLGRNTQELPIENPMLARIIRYLVQQDNEELLRIEGALRMYRGTSIAPRARSSRSGRKESLSDVLVGLARQIESSPMSADGKRASTELLSRIVLSVYEPDVDVEDDWAQLEEVTE